MTKTRIVVSAVELLRNHSKLTLAPLAPRKSTPKSITAVLALRRARDDEGQSAFHALSQVIPAPFPSPALGPSSGYDTNAKVLLPRSFFRERVCTRRFADRIESDCLFWASFQMERKFGIMAIS